MYKNEYLEECLKENKGNKYLVRGYIHTKDKNFNELVIDDLGFMYQDYFSLQEFKNELLKSNIKEFTLTLSSSGLMSAIHGLDSVDIKIKQVKRVAYINKWSNEDDYKEGLLMEVTE